MSRVELPEQSFTDLPTLEDIVPVYEYRCHDCKRRVSIFWRTFSDVDTESIACPRCSGTNLTRLISRVRMVRSEESRLDNLADPGVSPTSTKTIPRVWGAGCAR